MTTFYNEFDPAAAQWLRNLMADELLDGGTVDARSICDLSPDDVRRFTRCHFFAGIAGWELALDLAGWPRDRPVWTGSPPCQGFSSAGKGEGFDDPRDLWPQFCALARECRPQCIVGEQVANAVRFGWLDRVHADMEAAGYTVGAVVLGAHSAFAPHMRQRLYWCAHLADAEVVGRGAGAGPYPGRERAHEPRRLRRAGAVPDALREPRSAEPEQQHVERANEFGRSGGAVPVADGRQVRGRRRKDERAPGGDRAPVGNEEANHHQRRGGALPVADTDGGEPGHRGLQPGGEHGLVAEDGGARHMGNAAGGGSERDQDVRARGTHAVGASRPVWNHWDHYAVVRCSDERTRRVPTEPGLYPLAARVSGRVAVQRSGACAGPAVQEEEDKVRHVSAAAALRGAGNAVCVQTAALFVRAFLEAEAVGFR